MRSRVRAIAVAAAVAIGAGATVAPATGAAAGLKAIWGPAGFSAAAPLPGAPESPFALYDELGVDVFQLQIQWRTVAPTRPAVATDPDDAAYRWPQQVSAAIAAVAARGMEVAILVKGTPDWAAGAVSGSNAAPAVAQDYADFLTAASRRYPPIRRWMIWGETNREALWASGAASYARLLDAAYAAVHAVDADDIVVGGMTFSYGEIPPARWIAEMRLPGGNPPRLDEYGHNPFTRRCPDLAAAPDHMGTGTRDIGDIDTLIGEVRGTFSGAPKLWLSEFTVSSDRASWALDFFVDRAEQADWLAKAFAIAGSVDYVAGIGWFNLLDDGTRPDGLTTGLIAPDGTHKPAFEAYAAARLDGSQPRVPCPPADTPPASVPPADALPADPPATDAPPANAPAQPPNSAPVGDVDGGRVHADHSGPPPAPSDRRPVELRYATSVRLRSILRRGYRVGVRCPPGCRIDGSLHVRGGAARRLKLGRRAIRIGSTRAKSRSAGVTNLRIPVRRRNARVLRGLRSVALTLVVTTRHGTRAARLTRSVRLRP